MAFGMFRMMFNAGGNAVPVIEQMNTASKHLMATSSGLSTSLNSVGTSMGGLVRATASLTQFQAFEQALAGQTAQARHLQDVILQVATSMRTLGREVTGITDAQLALANSTDFESKQLEAGMKAKLRAANAYKAVAGSIRDVGSTGQVTSSKLAALSQTLDLFAQKTGVGGRAAILGFSQELQTASAQMKVAEANSNALRNGQVNLSSAQRVAHAETVKISDALSRFSIVGGASGSTMLRLANQLNTLSASVHPQFSTSLKAASGELLVFGNRLRMSEQAANKAGSAQGGFQMMTDVSTQTATKMRMMSSASQGAMIAMSLLQRNVTGLAFSLIFLQFSGFLKISLAIAGAMALVGGLALGFRALIQEGMKMKKLNDQFFILTGSTETSALAMDAAKTLAEKYGISIGPLLQAQIKSLTGKMELTNKEFDTFAGLLALADAGLIHNIEDSEALAKKFFSLKDSGKSMAEIFVELKLTTKTFREELENLEKTDLGKTNRRMAELKNSFKLAFEDPSASANKWWQNLRESFLLASTGAFKSFQDNQEDGVLDLATGIRGVIFAIQEPLANLFLDTLKLIFVDPWVDIARDTKSALSGMFEQFENFADNFNEGWRKSQEDTKMVQEHNWDEIRRTFGGDLGWLLARSFEWIKDFLKGIKGFGKDAIDIFASLWRDVQFEWLVFEMRMKRRINDFKEGGWKDSFNGLVTAGLDIITGGMYSIGKDGAKSLWNGLLSENLREKARNWARNFIESIKNAFRSGSPSKEMMKIGQDAMKGFAIGMGGTQGGRGTNNININISVSGAFSNNPRAASQSVATQVLKGITRQGAFSGAPLVA